MHAAFGWFYDKLQITVDSKNLEHRKRMIYAGCPSFPDAGFGGWSCSTFLTSSVRLRVDGLDAVGSMVYGLGLIL